MRGHRFSEWFGDLWLRLPSLSEVGSEKRDSPGLGHWRRARALDRRGAEAADNSGADACAANIQTEI